MKTTRTTRRGRRHPLVSVTLLVLGLLATGGTYALVTTTAATAETVTSNPEQIAQGQKLFAANCASCHGLNAQGANTGPNLQGVGAASVDFQVGTGRMPLAASGPQAEKKPVQFSEADVDAMAAYIASLAPGPAIPAEQYLQADGDASKGAVLFRTNCAMCHNVVGAGGALTEGKYAPNLQNVAPVHIYEAMLTGPQNMPVFNDMNISPQDKADIITYLRNYASAPSPGGFDLGGLGPVAEGLFMWIFGLGAVIAIAVWLTAKSN